MNETDVKKYWQQHPCGEQFAGGAEVFKNNAAEFFDSYDKKRYDMEPHILECLNNINFRNKKTLEIGLGQGSDSEQIIRSGADWTGIDLTSESTRRVKSRLKLKELKFAGIVNGSAVEMPFADDSFEIIFSHGVLHHIPEIKSAQNEIHRILKPDGELIIMLYAKNSVYYRLLVTIFRRMGLAAIYLAKVNSSDQINHHLKNMREIGLKKYLKMENFIHRNTDGALNPYSKVYDLAEVERDFQNFSIVRSYQRFMYAPPLPPGKLPFGNLLGWHLWVHLKPKH